MSQALSDNQPRFMRVVPAAEWSGLSPSTIRRWLAEGRLATNRPPGTRLVLIDLAELAAVLRGDHAAQPVGAA